MKGMCLLSRCQFGNVILNIRSSKITQLPRVISICTKMNSDSKDNVIYSKPLKSTLDLIFDSPTSIRHHSRRSSTSSSPSPQRSERSCSTGKASVLVTRQINNEALHILEERFRVTVWPEPDPIPRSELLEQVKGKDGLLCMLTDRIDKDVLDAADTLKVIATMSVGYDHLDVAELVRRRIRIGYTPNVLTDATADLTVGLLLAASRRLLESAQAARTGAWKTWAPEWLCGQGLRGATVGIAGLGGIGFEVGRRLHAFNVGQILYYNRSIKKEAERELRAKKVDFDRLLTQSDFVVCCLPLVPETKQLFSEMAFKKMKPNAIFINTSRGELVDQEALVKALKEKVIWGAGLDVMTPEPLPLDHELFQMDNCVILPHIGSATYDTRKEMAIVSANNILCGLFNKKMPSELTPANLK